eukprot:117384-Chlamydomonas_euryale.AAC.1
MHGAAAGAVAAGRAGGRGGVDSPASGASWPGERSNPAAAVDRNVREGKEDVALARRLRTPTTRTSARQLLGTERLTQAHLQLCPHSVEPHRVVCCLKLLAASRTPECRTTNLLSILRTRCPSPHPPRRACRTRPTCTPQSRGHPTRALLQAPPC